jgi:hypothetical protein
VTKRLYLDVHWRFVPPFFPFQIDYKGIWSRTQETDILHHHVLTFGAEDQALASLLNGGKGLWPQLEGLVTFAALITKSDVDFETFRARCRSNRCARLLEITLYLCGEVLKVNAPGRSSLTPADRELCSAIIANLGDDDGSLPTAAMAVSRALADRPIDAWRSVATTVMNPNENDWSQFDYHDRFLPLLYVMRPFRLLTKAARKAAKRGAQP